MTDTTATSDNSIQILESPKIPIIPFAVTLPNSSLQGPDDPTLQNNSSLSIGKNGIVGTITLLQNSIIVWVGWGKLDHNDTTNDNFSEFGRGRPEQVSLREFLNRFFFFRMGLLCVAYFKCFLLFVYPTGTGCCCYAKDQL